MLSQQNVITKRDKLRSFFTSMTMNILSTSKLVLPNLDVMKNGARCHRLALETMIYVQWKREVLFQTPTWTSTMMSVVLSQTINTFQFALM